MMNLKNDDSFLGQKEAILKNDDLLFGQVRSKVNIQIACTPKR